RELSEKVNFFAGEKTKIQILNLLHDHVTHHRGQLVVYLNLKEIKPPRYTGW
ncbi:MAG: DinB family protein, partial [Flavobacteriaceae bacterium]|nr:DinB family protein [Flavobacteriaceae bacterium]